MSKRTVTPLRPEEVAKAKRDAIPDVVIQAFNTLLVRNFKNSGITNINVDEAILEIQDQMRLSTGSSPSRAEIFDQNWLDIELLYQEFGWIVNFVKSEPDDNFVSYWMFRRDQ